MGKKKAATKQAGKGNGANLGFEAKLWLAAGIGWTIQARGPL